MQMTKLADKTFCLFVLNPAVRPIVRRPHSRSPREPPKRIPEKCTSEVAPDNRESSAQSLVLEREAKEPSFGLSQGAAGRGSG